MTITLDGTTGITTPTTSTTGEFVTSVTGFKNRIINGAMVIDQRNAGASVTPTSNGYYSCDRWQVQLSQASKFSIQQNAGAVTPPAGFTKYLGITSLSAYSLGAGDFFNTRTQIEGFNTADLAWGTASASAVTLSFWVRSSLTGTFGGALGNGGGTRGYPFTYTISATNTWEQKTITVAGDTTGTWATDNSSGLIVYFGLGVGSTYSGTAGAWAGSQYMSATGATSVVGTNGATFYITGVQLEKGSTATSFDVRSYGTELALCQRYLPAITATSANEIFGSGMVNTPSECRYLVPFQVTPRISPTGVTVPNVSLFNVDWPSNAGGGLGGGSINFLYGGTACAALYVPVGGAPTGYASFLRSNTAGAQILFTGCEL